MTGLREQLEQSLGHTYSFERELEGGGMSRVFLAEERALGRKVVIKVLAPELAGGVNIERFVREVHVAARLQHPNVVPLLSAGEADRVPYYTMPYVAGEPLRARLARDGALPIAEAVAILHDVAAALAYAHGEGVVHRDIKPDNVLVSGDGCAQVADFGLAKALGVSSRAGSLTGSGITVGTPAYMAPEQVIGDPTADHRADLYAWGALAYEMLAGRPPFDGSTLQEVLAAHVNRKPEPLSTRRKNVPRALAALVMRCLAKDPAERPQTAGEVLRELDVISGKGGGELPASARRRVGTYVGLAAVLVAVVGAFVLRVLPRERGADLDSPGIESVAVLPFANLSADKENEYFSDGMTDELINALTHLPELRVTARSSAFALKGKELDAREVARRLGVAKVVEGSVRREHGQLRLTAQLVDATSGKTLWSETYQRDANDALGVQEELAHAITGAIQPKLSSARASAPATRPTRDPEAYDLYLRGRYLANLRSKAAVDQSIDYFRQALRRDSSFALAYAGIAFSYSILVDHGYMSTRDAYPRSKAAATKALALDETVSDAHETLGYLKSEYDWDPEGAEREYKRALELSPGSAYGHYRYGTFLADQRRFEEATRQIRIALQLDPLSLIIGANFGRVLAFARRSDEAIAQCRKVVELNPSFGVGRFWMGVVLLDAGRPAEALLELQAADSAMPGTSLPRAGLVIAYARLGDRQRALQIVRALEQPSTSPPAFPVAMAAAYTALGDHDQAFRWLDRGSAERSSGMTILAADPLFDPLRSDPRLPGLLRRIGLSR